MESSDKETWGVLWSVEHGCDDRAFHIIGTQKQAERWAYDKLVKHGFIVEPDEEQWQELLWECIDDELEPGEIEICPLSHDLETRIAKYLDAVLPVQTASLQMQDIGSRSYKLTTTLAPPVAIDLMRDTGRIFCLASVDVDWAQDCGTTVGRVTIELTPGNGTALISTES